MLTDIYRQLQKEADEVYRRLTSERSHLKSNSLNKHPPYDYSDIVEKSKDEAMRQIARGGDEHTSYYWSLATETDDCPNWIARWFLYHKFRYRDGRNRNPAKSHGGKHKHSSHSSKNSYHRHTGDTGESSRHSDSYYATAPSSSTYGVFPFFIIPTLHLTLLPMVALISWPHKPPCSLVPMHFCSHLIAGSSLLPDEWLFNRRLVHNSPWSTKLISDSIVDFLNCVSEL